MSDNVLKAVVFVSASVSISVACFASQSPHPLWFFILIAMMIAG